MDLKTRFQTALGKPNPNSELHTILKQLKAEGFTQAEVYAVLIDMRDEYDHTQDHGPYDQLSDALDGVCGYIHRDYWIWPKIYSPSLEELAVRMRVLVGDTKVDPNDPIEGDVDLE